MKKNKRAGPDKALSLRTLAETALAKKKKTSNPEIPPDDVYRLIAELEVHQIELEMQNEELRRTHVELEKSRSNYVDLYDHAPAGYFTLNVKGLITEVNLPGASMLQVERGLLINNPFSCFVHENDQDAYYLHCNQLIKTVKQQSAVIRLKRKDVSVFYAHMECLPVKDSRGSIYQIRMVINDVTERWLAEEDVGRVKAEWERTFDLIPDIIMIIDNQFRVKRANKALSERLGIDRNELIGRTCYSVTHGTAEPLSYCLHSKGVLSGRAQVAEIYEEKLKGHFIFSSTPMWGTNGKSGDTVEVWRDISSRKEMEEKLRESSITDELTGIMNRRGFLTLAEQQCKIADRNRTNVSLVFLDLDGMKKINDTHGHREGDRALINVSRIITSTFREADIVGRIGGDEFAALLTEPPDQDIESTILDHINNNIRQFNEQSSCCYDLSLSIGVANSEPVGPCSIEDLLIRADYAMYRNKRLHTIPGPETALSKVANERRNTARRSAGENCEVKIGESELIRIKNISAGGICLSSMDHPMTNKFYSMTVSIESKKIPLKGIMVWSKLTELEDYDAGLKFIGMTGKDRISLADIISHRE